MSSSIREWTKEDLKGQAVWEAISVLPRGPLVKLHDEIFAICKQYDVELMDEDGVIYRPDGTFGRDFN